MPIYKIMGSCKQCGLCMEKCPFKAIAQNGDAYQVTEDCEECGLCIENCPSKSIAEITEDFRR